MERQQRRLGFIPSVWTADPRVYVTAVGKGVEELLTRWGFGPERVTEAEATAEVSGNTLLASTRPLTLRAKLRLVTDDWHDPDGMDANMLPGRAGKHGSSTSGGEDSLLYRQVRRMTFLGLPAGGLKEPLMLRGWGLLSGFVRFPEVALQGTFVVSHGYQDNARFSGTRGCDGVKHEVKHPAFRGLNNLDPRAGGPDYGPGTERPALGGHGGLKCLDTTPFRDTQSYDGTAREDGSLAVLGFGHRGDHFMGCRAAMVDDVTSKECDGW
jgi:hypothetical protein